MSFARDFLYETQQIIENLDYEEVEKIARILLETKVRRGRLFVIGVGGSAGNAIHAVNDFRKIAEIETYSPLDNVCELTARINDEGWGNSLKNCLVSSNLSKQDVLLILSVGGGDLEKNISVNIISAINLALSLNSKIIGIVGNTGGYTARSADACVIIPPLYLDRITPHTESITSVILHLLVSHPLLKTNQTKWESKNNETKN